MAIDSIKNLSLPLANKWLKFLMLLYLVWLATIFVALKTLPAVMWLGGLAALILEWKHYLTGLKRLDGFLAEQPLQNLASQVVFNHPRLKIIYLEGFGYFPLTLPASSSLEFRRFWQASTSRVS